MSQFPDPSALHPSDGARFLLERESVTDDDSDAVYRASIFTPDTRFDYRVHMQLDGDFELSLQSARADSALEKKLSAIARLTARGAAKKLSRQLPPWPHRILRWRGPGR